MTYRVELSGKADLDLREIYEYIAFDLQAPGNAIELLYRLEKAILSLDKMPYRFREYEDEKWAVRGLRIMPVDNYCVLYIPDDTAGLVTIVRIIHGARDLPAILQEV